MKKFLLIPAIASFIITGCSNDNITQQERPEEESGVRSYLHVALVAPKGNTRADGQDDDENYVNGTTDENNINSVRFYFFDEEGNATEVYRQTASGTYLSYIDWIPTEGEQSPGPVEGQTIEKIANATLSINMPDINNGFPALVVAVINPPESLLALEGNPSLETLRSEVADYLTGYTDNNFIISNSVYAENGAVIYATKIDKNVYSDNADDAESSSLNIYVERVVARLDLSIGMQGEELQGDDNSSYYIYPLEDPYTVEGTSTDIYVKLLGWNVTATPNKSRLIKSINATKWWNTDLFGNLEPWNNQDYHRSYWAINPPASDYSYLFGNFNGSVDTKNENYCPANALPLPAPTSEGSIPETVKTYLQENAAFLASADAADQEPVYSKVILAAQLVDNQGNAIPLAQWANRYYTPDGVVEAACNTLNLYQSGDGGTTFSKITPGQLQIVTATELYGKEEIWPEGVSYCDVFLQLTEQPEDITWYNGNTSTSPQLTPEQANTYIIDRIGNILVWNKGMTYYYFNIRHLGAEGSPGYWGVVRNHIYQANITSIAGLGTPVYNPDEVIYPEMPGPDDSVISAVVSILQWRIVTNDYEIIWP